MDVDWNLVATIAGAGYGVSFLVLIVLALCAWLAGQVMQRFVHPQEDEQTSDKK